jgi:hypothetical protein
LLIDLFPATLRRGDRFAQLHGIGEIAAETKRFVGICCGGHQTSLGKVLASSIDQRLYQFADQILTAAMGSNIGLAKQLVRFVQPAIGQRPLAMFESQDYHGFIP